MCRMLAETAMDQYETITIEIHYHVALRSYSVSTVLLTPSSYSIPIDLTHLTVTSPHLSRYVRRLAKECDAVDGIINTYDLNRARDRALKRSEITGYEVLSEAIKGIKRYIDF